MKRFSEQLHKQSQTVKLKKSEQVDLRARLVSYMEYHPLPADMKAAQSTVSHTTKSATQRTTLTESFTQYAIPYQMLFKFGSVAAVFVLVVIPFMAERTVPGDTLYAVKVQFNEEVRSTLTWGSYEKVEWETARLNRRIAEARLLADEGLLTEAVEASVAAAVKTHSDNAKREIEVLRASDADEATIATIAFDSSLEVQAQTFTESADQDTEDTEGVSFARTGMLISDAIDASLEKTPQTPEVDLPAYSKLMARVELNTTRVQELRDSLVGVVSDQDLADATRRIEDIDRVVAEAIELSGEPETEIAAREALVDVLTRTQKLIVFMADLEVQERVEIESVVPVVLTTDEMESDRAKRIKAIKTLSNKLSVAEETLEDDDLQLKVLDSVTKLNEAESLLTETESYTDFVTLSDQAIALGTDTLGLVDMPDIEVLEIVDAPVVATTTATSSDEAEPKTATTTDEIEVESPEVVDEPAASTTDPVDSEDTQPEVDTEL